MVEFTAHIANLGKYTEGILNNADLSFPTTTQQVQVALRSIGVDGLRYEEIIVTDYTVSIPGYSFAKVLPQYASIDELNYLSSRINTLSPEAVTKFAAAVQHGEYRGNLQDLINLTYNLDCYDYFPQVKDHEAYGRYLVDTRRDFHLPKMARYYFDYAQYGEDTAINEGGELTAHGYIFNNQSPFNKVYDGENVPREYRVFQYPIQRKVRERQPSKQRNIPSR